MLSDAMLAAGISMLRPQERFVFKFGIYAHCLGDDLCAQIASKPKMNALLGASKQQKLTIFIVPF